MEFKTTIEIQNTEKVDTLIHLLNKYKEQLPCELVESVNNLADCEHCEIDAGTFELMGIGAVDLLSNGVEINDVLSINPILKRVTKIWTNNDGAHVIDDCVVDIYSWPLSLDVMKGGKRIDSLSW